MSQSMHVTQLRLVSLVAITLATSRAHAVDPCQPVYEALTKVVTTPSHSYTTHTAAFLKGGKPQSSETIYVGGKSYILVNGKWRAGHVSPKDTLEQQKENRADGKTSCQFVRSEAVNGQAANLYSLHSENEGDKEDAQVWISKSTGLLLRSEQDVDVGGAIGKEHRLTRFEYGNVRPPM